MIPGMDEDFSENAQGAKKKVRGPSKQRAEQRGKASTVVESDIQAVYEHWCSVMRPNRKNPAKLDVRGRECVAAAIADYGVDTCKQAIDGCSKSPFHMGRNKQNRRYDSLELIFRNHEKIEKFLSYVQSDDEPW
jgi:hypothetical protein